MSWERLCLGEAKALVPWFLDESVTDILINGSESLYVERYGTLERHASPFSPEGLRDFLDRLLVPLGRRVDATQPYLDGRLGDVARFHAVLSPAVRGAPHLSFRLFRDQGRASLESFGEVAWIESRLKAGDNLLLCGATGSGKTTLLCRLLERMDPGERIVVVEESREIQLGHPHVVHLEGRPSGPEGVGEITLRALLRQALRMRPDRLVLGECRGEEAFELIQALNTGHRGSLSTLHANSCRDALRRLESLVWMGCPGVAITAVREWVAGAIQGVVHLERRGEQRGVVEVLEVRGLEGEVYRITPKYRSMVPPRGDGRSPLASESKVCEFTPLCR